MADDNAVRKVLGGFPNNADSIPREREDLAFSYILEVLTQGLYPNVLDVIREYVQNAYDAVVRHNKMYKGSGYKIKVDITDGSVFVSDNGIGMTEADIRKYRYIGYSGKTSRESAGFRGIGKLSGISVAEDLIVSSKVQGVAKGYTIRFNARAMLEEIVRLKRDGKNKPLNELILANTEFDSFDDPIEDHYTIVEMRKIRPEHSVMLDPVEIAHYVKSICPVPLDPNFDYAEQIDKQLIANVEDYAYYPHLVNNQSVFKPYPPNLDPPQFFTIEGTEGGEPIAYGWACQNRLGKQIADDLPRGLAFRVKNISIGDGRHARTILWKHNSHLAYWFYGEIHVVDEAVIPSSERSSFEDNAARQRLVERCHVDLVGPLVRAAHQQSSAANAEKKRQALQRLINDTNTSLAERTIPKENVVYEAAKVIAAAEQLRKSIGRFKGQKRVEVEDLLTDARDVIATLTADDLDNGDVGCSFDIKEHVHLNESEVRFYDLVVDWLKDVVFHDQPERFGSAIAALHERMLKEYPLI